MDKGVRFGAIVAVQGKILARGLARAQRELNTKEREPATKERESGEPILRSEEAPSESLPQLEGSEVR